MEWEVKKGEREGEEERETIQNEEIRVKWERWKDGGWRRGEWVKSVESLALSLSLSFPSSFDSLSLQCFSGCVLLCVQNTSVRDKKQIVVLYLSTKIFPDAVNFKHCLQYFISSFTLVQKHVHLSFCILMCCSVLWKWIHFTFLTYTKNYLLFKWEINYGNRKRCLDQ